MSDIRGVLLNNGNYGVALMKEPVVICHHRVWHMIEELKKRNSGKIPQFLRQYDIIRVASGRYAGVWRITGINDKQKRITLNMVKPADVKFKSEMSYAKEASLNTLMADGLEVLKLRYTGIALCRTT